MNADSRESVATRMRGRVKEVVLAAAERSDMDAAEFLRRGLWLIMRFPSLIELTNADEEDYQKTLGGSRWHKENTDKSPEM
ncbi:hypothetical protein D1223_13715 [Henriciella mobilis]|uniref:Uncharacterized protein n=2 Tax=Henriciella mobilis TaxID=2305467 RepID=A0A399REG2_9PROT|nr:hypothetical protein D1223_13715 [Henriciella mobilis]